MASTVGPWDVVEGRYRGLGEIFEFVNGDGRWRKFNCGQAAACTFLTHHDVINPADDASRLMREIEKQHPPDNLGGWLGTSRRRVERICRAHGVKLDELNGREELMCSLDSGEPAIVMLGTPGKKVLGFTLPAGHWMVAYGYDDQHIFLTNYGRMDWNQFTAGWGSLVPRLIRMHYRALAPSSNVTV